MNLQPKRGRACAICKHPDRYQIELLRASGVSLTALAEKFSVDKDSVWRHWHRHVSDEAKASYLVGPVDFGRLAEKAALEGDSVLDYLRLCRTTLTARMVAMAEGQDARGVALVAGQLTRTLEAIAKVTGELGTLAQATVNITNNTNVAVLAEHPVWLRTQAAMLRALAPFPDARAAVVTALRDMDGPSSSAPTAGQPAPQVINHVAA